MEADSQARELLDNRDFICIITINIVIYIMNKLHLICICLRRGA